MAPENVDRFREGIEAFNRRDLDGLLRPFDPEVRFEHRLAALQGSFVGIDGVRDWINDVWNHFESGRVVCADIRDLDDRVLALGTVYGTGRESGVEIEQPYTVVARFEDRLITEFTDYGDKQLALEAVGLAQ